MVAIVVLTCPSRHKSKNSRRLHGCYRRPDGSGKTTLAALVARLWEAPEGEFSSTGVPSVNGHLTALRRSIGYVPPRALICSAKRLAAISPRPAQTTISTRFPSRGNRQPRSDVEGFTNKYETRSGERVSPSPEAKSSAPPLPAPLSATHAY